MKLRSFRVSLAVLFISLVSSAQVLKDKADVYMGYSHVGANLYGPNTSGMNGWQLALHLKTMSPVGIEGDISRYSQKQSGYSQQVMLYMFGPRVTMDVKGYSLFAHGLFGAAHESATVTIYPSTSYSATSYAIGGGGEAPLFRGLKLRVTGDYLGNSKAPSSEYSPSHYRVGTGIAYHF